jgi:hypothetical protein
MGNELEVKTGTEGLNESDNKLENEINDKQIKEDVWGIKSAETSADGLLDIFVLSSFKG